MTGHVAPYPNELRMYIKLAGFSVRKVSKETNIPESTLHDWAAGNRVIPYEERQVLASLLDCDVKCLAPRIGPSSLPQTLLDGEERDPPSESGPITSATEECPPFSQATTQGTIEVCVSKPEIESGASGLPAPKLWHFIVSDPTRHFWQIAHTDYSIPDEMTAAIGTAIKEMNMTTGDNITRRDALCELASIPLITLGQTRQLHARRYEEMLRFCTVALPSCWELYRGSDPIGTQHAFECCSTYVPMLETMAHDSSTLRKQALDLAAQYALLKTWLGWICVGARGTVPIAQHAMNLSEETEDILLQLSAYTKLGWAYFADRQYPNALEIMQKGEAVLKRYQRRLVLPEHVVGGFYSTYSLVQVNNGISPDTTLGIATNSTPGREDRGFIQFTRSSQLLEAAWICTTKGDSPQAIGWIAKRMDLKTLAPLSGVSQSARGRIETVNVLTRALLQSNERDMGEIIRIWKVGMEGAQTLRSEGRYEEAIANFEAMRILWPKEPAIRALMPMTSHW